MIKIRILLALSFVLLSFCLKAQSITEKTFYYGVGQVGFKNTYLSPLNYSGIDGIYRMDTFWGDKEPGNRLKTRINRHLNFSYLRNYQESNELFHMSAYWSIGKYHKMNILEDWSLYLGGMFDINASGEYSQRNSNNPASFFINSNIDFSAISTYSLKIKKVPIKIRAELSLALLGVILSEDYGKSYYEMFTLKNHKDFFSFSSLHNNRVLRYTLSASVPISKSSILIGYSGELSNSNIREIGRTINRHMFVVGYSKQIQLLPYRQSKANKSFVKSY